MANHYYAAVGNLLSRSIDVNKQAHYEYEVLFIGIDDAGPTELFNLQHFVIVEFDITGSDVQIENDVVDSIVAFAANANNTSMGFVLPRGNVILPTLSHG